MNTQMLNFSSSKLFDKYCRYIKSFAYDTESFNKGLDDEQLDLAKKLMLEEGSNSAFNSVIKNHSNLISVANDEDFMNSLKEKNSSMYNNLVYFANKSLAMQRAIRKSQYKRAKDQARIKAIRTAVDGLLASYEEPAASFMRGIADAITDYKIELSDLKNIDDEDTGFNLLDTMKKLGNDKSNQILDKMESDEGAGINDTPSTESTTSESTETSTESNEDTESNPDISVDAQKVKDSYKDFNFKSLEDVYKLAEDSGKAAFGAKYNEDIAHGVVEKGIEKYGKDDINNLVMFVKVTYRSVWN